MHLHFYLCPVVNPVVAGVHNVPTRGRAGARWPAIGARSAAQQPGAHAGTRVHARLATPLVSGIRIALVRPLICFSVIAKIILYEFLQ